VSAAVYLDHARAIAEPLIKRQQARTGRNFDDARDDVARALGWAPGTLYNLMRDRLKKLDGDLRASLTAYAIEDLQDEIAALGRQLESAERLGRPQDQAMADKAARLLREAQALHARLGGGAE